MISLLKRMISFKTVTTSYQTPPEDSSPFVEFLRNILENLGFECRIEERRKGFPNLLANFHANKPKTVCFVSHYDVVPTSEKWKYDPFKAKQVKDRIYGRGASDAKGGIAAFIQAVKELEDPKFNLKFVCVGDEEIGGKFGMRWLFKKHKRAMKANVYYVLDCSTEGVEIGCSGSISGKIKVFGKSGHSAYPFRFENALEKSILLSQKLLEWKKKEEKCVSKKARAPPNEINEFLWNRFSITMLHSGQKANIIPEISEITFNWRLIPEEDPEVRKRELEKEIEKWKKKLNIRCEVKFLPAHRGYMIDQRDEFVLRLKESVERVKKEKMECICAFGASDGSMIFHETKKPTIGFGPIDSDSNFHGDNEFIRISTLKLVKNVIKNFLSQNL